MTDTTQQKLTAQKNGRLGELGAGRIRCRAEKVDLERVGERVDVERQTSHIKHVTSEL